MYDAQGERKYLTEAERWAFFEAVEAHPQCRYRLLCLTLFYTGCRVSEALALTPRRFDLPNRTLVFETLKRRKRGIFRAVPIPRTLAELLCRALQNRPYPGTRLWPICRSTAYRIVKRRMSEAGIEGVKASPKGLRHGFAIACIRQKTPLPLVQKWLGHASLETTAIYLNVMDEEERDYARQVWKGSLPNDLK